MEGGDTLAERDDVVPLPRVSVVMPTLNEAENLPHVLARLPADLHELIVVDGGSRDGTVAVASRLRPAARVVMQTRTGKGNALACGFAAATGDIIVTVDADGSADPAELPRFVQALLQGADLAKGTRFAEGGGSADITRVRAAGNRALSWLVNRCFGTGYTDLCYGYNAFWRRLVPLLTPDAAAPPVPGRAGGLGDGFEVEALMYLRAARAGLRIVEVPSYEHRRIHGASNLRTVGDGVRVLRTIMRERRHAVRAPGAPAWPAPTFASAGSASAEALPDTDARGQDGIDAPRGGGQARGRGCRAEPTMPR
jgi:glycosyltransferase involved in cell wall biosynthesis